jgi:hypothetical protein
MKTNTAITIGVIAVLALGLALYLWKGDSALLEGETASTTPVISTTTESGTTPPKGATSSGSTNGFSTYTNAEYGFTMKYPSYVKAKSSFSTFHEVGTNWRINAGAANQGKAIVAFPVFSVDQGSVSNGKQTYPLYFMSEVRVGTSLNTKDCYATDSGYTNQSVVNVTIGGVTFKKFSSSNAGMMKYSQVESYRTIRNNTCFVIEQIKSGSSYKDDLMKPGISESALNNYHSLAETIARTFTFTK